TGNAHCVRTSGESVAGSPYTITCDPGNLAADNYNFQTGNTANFTINNASSEERRVGNSKTYGDSDQAFSYPLNGSQFSKTKASRRAETPPALTGNAHCVRTSGESVAGSPYTITCDPGNLAADNYNFQTGNTANFTINKA